MKRNTFITKEFLRSNDFIENHREENLFEFYIDKYNYFDIDITSDTVTLRDGTDYIVLSKKYRYTYQVKDLIRGLTDKNIQYGEIQRKYFQKD